MVVIDRFYRQESAGGNISTDFTLDLSDKLTKVLSMRIWSTQIPLTYYNIDDVYGNTCFWITNDGQDVPVSVPPGSYTSATLKTAIETAFTTAGFTFGSPPISYDPITFKIKFEVKVP